MLDDMSVRRIIKALAPAVDRNYVVMEVKKNLLPEERKKALAMFPSHSFKRICQVRMGEPDDEFKAAVQDSILATKKAKAEAEAKRKRQERDRKKAEDLRKKKAEAAKKAREEAAKKAKEARLAKAKGEEVPKEEDKEDKMDVDEKEEEAVEEEIVAEEVSLTEEDKKVLFIKKNVPDIVPQEVSNSFSKFTLPDGDEGFDRIDFPWGSEEKCKEHLRSWSLAKKLTERVETLKPSEWFKGKWDEWTKTVIAWKKKQQEFKDPVARKKAAAAKKKAEEDKKKKEAEDKKDSDEKKEGDAEETPAKEEDEEKMEINMEDLDVFS